MTTETTEQPSPETVLIPATVARMLYRELETLRAENAALKVENLRLKESTKHECK